MGIFGMTSLSPPHLFELHHAPDHVAQFTPKEIAPSSGRRPCALQHRLSKQEHNERVKMSTSTHTDKLTHTHTHTPKQIKQVICLCNPLHYVKKIVFSLKDWL